MSVLNGPSAADMEVWCEQTIEAAPESSVKTAASHLLVVCQARGKEIEQLREWQRQMVEIQASGGRLDGYRELAAKLAARDDEIERLRAELTVKHHDWMNEYGSAAEGRREIARLRDELERNRADLIVEADRANGAEAERDALRKDAERYGWLRDRLIAAEFDYGDGHECVLVFSFPGWVGVGGNCDQNIDAALATKERT